MERKKLYCIMMLILLHNSKKIAKFYIWKSGTIWRQLGSKGKSLLSDLDGVTNIFDMFVAAKMGKLEYSRSFYFIKN